MFLLLGYWLGVDKKERSDRVDPGWASPVRRQPPGVNPGYSSSKVATARIGAPLALTRLMGKPAN